MNQQVSTLLRHIFELRNLNVSRETLNNLKVDLNQITKSSQKILIIYHCSMCYYK